METETTAMDLTNVEELLEEINIKLENIELKQDEEITYSKLSSESLQLLNCFIVFFIIVILLKYAYKFLDIFF